MQANTLQSVAFFGILLLIASLFLPWISFSFTWFDIETVEYSKGLDSWHGLLIFPMVILGASLALQKSRWLFLVGLAGIILSLVAYFTVTAQSDFGEELSTELSVGIAFGLILCWLSAVLLVVSGIGFMRQK